MRGGLLLAGAAILAAVWLGPLPTLATRAFWAHMVMHMAVVTLAAPALSLGVAGGRFDPARRWPALFSPVPASFLELIVVWVWHVPALHHVARTSAAGLFLEQGTFLLAGLWLWMAAYGGEPRLRSSRAAAGVAALVLTSVHMTLLGALLTLAPRPLYSHRTGPGTISALQDQHLGGALMILFGGAVYLVAGLHLTTRMLSSAQPKRRRTAIDVASPSANRSGESLPPDLRIRRDIERHLPDSLPR